MIAVLIYGADRSQDLLTMTDESVSDAYGRISEELGQHLNAYQVDAHRTWLSLDSFAPVHAGESYNRRARIYACISTRVFP